MTALRWFPIVPICGLLSGPLCPAPAAAQWQPNGAPLCTAPGDQAYHVMVSDGAGGAIVAWLDERSTGDIIAGGDIYAQRVSAAGVPLWAPDGVPIGVGFTILRGVPAIASDGAGGAIITWAQYRSSGNSDIYAQRVSAAGATQWTPNGVVLCAARGWRYNPTVVSDGAGGAIITWEDERRSVRDLNILEADVYAQRVNAAGVPQWEPDGVALCSAPRFQRHPVIVSDGAAGAIVGWTDSRGGPNALDIYTQRVSAAGMPQWALDGVPLCAAVGYQASPDLIADGVGGAIATWTDERDGFPDIYAQRVNAAGVVHWAPDGVPLCKAADYQLDPALISDGTGGAIVTWEDFRNGFANRDLYAQRVSAAGVPQWTVDGVVVSAARHFQLSPTLVPDGAGGAIIAWLDWRTSLADGIYAQRMSAAGVPQWTPDGVELFSSGGTAPAPEIVPDGAGGAIIAWSDKRIRDAGSDLYAQRVSSDGAVGVTVVAIDIHPGSVQNPLNLNSDLLRVAILGSPEFEVSRVDPATVRLAGARVQPDGGRSPAGVHSDVNGDGVTDLSLKVVVAEMQVGPEDTVAVLTGMTFDGQRLTGRDRIRIVGASERGPTPFVHEAVDTTGDVGRYASLALDAQGNPGISYYDATHGDLKYASKSGGVWMVETVDTTGLVGQYTSLALDAEGNPRIAYLDGEGWTPYLVGEGRLKYASKSGGVWTAETVGGKIVTGHTSLALDAEGNPRIVYSDFFEYHLSYATKSGATWTRSSVGRGEIQRLYPSLALDALGNPHVTYWDVRFQNLIYASRAGGPWSFETVDVSGDVGRYSSLALDAEGNSHISYYDAGFDDLRYARKSAGAWTLETVDAGGDVGEHTSLALDAEGNPRISYYDATNADLKFASKSGGVWTLETVDATGSVGEHTSLALDAEGNPRISYYDATNGDLKYAVFWEHAPRASRGPGRAQGSLAPGASSDRPARPLAAWPLPYRGGDLTVSFATFGGPDGGDSEARVGVYDLSGRQVRALAQGRFPAGHQSATWDGGGEDGRAVPNGVYFIRAHSLAHDEVLKVVVIR